MQQFAEAGRGLPPAPMAAAGSALGHEARLLEREADEAVGERHAVIAADEVVKVPDVEAAVGVAVQAQHALDLGHRRLAGRGQLAAIIEANHLIGLVAGAPTAQAPGIDAEDIGRLQPAEGTTQGAQDDFLSLHRPLHGGREAEHRHLLGYRCLYSAPPEKRTFRLLSGADRSCAPYSSNKSSLPPVQGGLERRSPWGGAHISAERH